MKNPITLIVLVVVVLLVGTTGCSNKSESERLFAIEVIEAVDKYLSGEITASDARVTVDELGKKISDLSTSTGVKTDVQLISSLLSLDNFDDVFQKRNGLAERIGELLRDVDTVAFSGIPQETLDAIARHIADNSQGRVSIGDVTIRDRDGRVDVNVTRGTGHVETTFGAVCELVSDATIGVLTELDLELRHIMVSAVSSANSNHKVTWLSDSSGTFGQLTDSREDSVPGGWYNVADISDAFLE
jgi:hypothetical protein